MKYVTKEIVNSLNGNEELIKNLNKILEDNVQGHSSLQIDKFIISGDTTWGKLHQCKREVSSRVKNLYTLKLDNDLLDIDRSEIVNELKKYDNYDEDTMNECDLYNKKRSLIELQKKDIEIYEGKKSYDSNIKELSQFYDICIDLYEQLDIELQSATDEELESKYWENKFIDSAKNHIFSRMIGVDSGIIEAARKLDDNLIDKLSIVPAQMKSYLDSRHNNKLK